MQTCPCLYIARDTGGNQCGSKKESCYNTKGKCLRFKRCTDICSLDNCSPDNCPPDNCSPDNCSLDNCSLTVITISSSSSSSTISSLPSKSYLCSVRTRQGLWGSITTQTTYTFFNISQTIFTPQRPLQICQ